MKKQQRPVKVLVMAPGSYKSILSLRIVTLAQQLSQAGNDVSMILPAADKYNDFQPDPQASLPGVTLIQPWQFTTKSPILNLVPYMLTSLLAVLSHRADVIYLGKPTPMTIMGIVPRLFGTPVIADYDDLGGEVMKGQGQPAPQYKLVMFCEWLAARCASGFAAASTYFQSRWSKAYPKKPVLLLPNGVDPTDYPKAAEQTPRHAIYYFGAINRLSLIETFIQALPQVLASVPDTKITIAGGGSALEDAEALVRKLGVSKAVTFTGWLKPLDILKYTGFGDIAICYQEDIPTVRACSNMKVFQYMAMSSASVVSDVGDLRAYVKDGTVGRVVPAGDKAALAETLTQLLNDPAARIAIAHAGRTLAESDYSWQEHGRQLSDFLGSFTRKSKA